MEPGEGGEGNDGIEESATDDDESPWCESVSAPPPFSERSREEAVDCCESKDAVDMSSDSLILLSSRELEAMTLKREGGGKEGETDKTFTC